MYLCRQSASGVGSCVCSSASSGRQEWQRWLFMRGNRGGASRDRLKAQQCTSCLFNQRAQLPPTACRNISLPRTFLVPSAHSRPQQA
eukprot:11019076-Alexandrium_andersonii.AAC.1